MIIFLHGVDSFRSRRMLQEMKDKFIREVDTEASSLDVIDGQTADLKMIDAKINTGSLFTRKRLIIIEQIFKNKKTKIFAELAAYLPKVVDNDNLILIFRDETLDGKTSSLKTDAKKLFSFLSKQKYVQEFKKLTPSGLLSFIKLEAKLYNKEISASVATELAKRTNGDLWLITQGVKKAAFRHSNQEISLADIKEATAEAFNENIFSLTDAIGAKNKRLALRILEEQYAAGLSDEYLLAMLIRQIKILLQVNLAIADGLKPEAVASQLKLHPFVVKKGIVQSKNFSKQQLKNYLNRLIALDHANKTGGNDIRSELILWLAEL